MTDLQSLSLIKQQFKLQVGDLIHGGFQNDWTGLVTSESDREYRIYFSSQCSMPVAFRKDRIRLWFSDPNIVSLKEVYRSGITVWKRV